MYHSHYFFLTKISIHFGSSGFVGGFRRMRLSNREPVPRARSCRDRCRYRYICRPKRIQFSLRGRLKLLRFLGELGIEFVTACEFTLCAFDFGNDFVVEADLVLAVFVVDEAGKGKRIGQGRLKVISDNLDILLGLDPTYAC